MKKRKGEKLYILIKKTERGWRYVDEGLRELVEGYFCILGDTLSANRVGCEQQATYSRRFSDWDAVKKELLVGKDWSAEAQLTAIRNTKNTYGRKELHENAIWQTEAGRQVQLMKFCTQGVSARVMLLLLNKETIRPYSLLIDNYVFQET